MVLGPPCHRSTTLDLATSIPGGATAAVGFIFGNDDL
jgi:hypothetical protein